MLSFLIVGLYQ